MLGRILFAFVVAIAASAASEAFLLAARDAALPAPLGATAWYAARFAPPLLAAFWMSGHLPRWSDVLACAVAAGAGSLVAALASAQFLHFSGTLRALTDAAEAAWWAAYGGVLVLRWAGALSVLRVARARVQQRVAAG